MGQAVHTALTLYLYFIVTALPPASYDATAVSPPPPAAAACRLNAAAASHHDHATAAAYLSSSHFAASSIADVAAFGTWLAIPFVVG